MEFPRFSLKSSALDQRVLSENIEPLCITKVLEIQDEIKKAELKDRKNRLLHSNPLKYLFLVQDEPIAIGISLLACICGAVFKINLVKIYFGLLSLTLFIFAIMRDSYDYFEVWKESPFVQDFRKEYKGDIAGRLDHCPDCEQPNIILTVVWHPFSPIRFLKATHRDNLSESYYVDWWDVSPTEMVCADCETVKV